MVVCAATVALFESTALIGYAAPVGKTASVGIQALVVTVQELRQLKKVSQLEISLNQDKVIVALVKLKTPL